MKKVTNLMSGILVCSLLVSGQAFAATVVDVDETGSGSNNPVDIANECSVEVDSNTEVEVGNTNDQNSGSGDAGTDGNTDGGEATTGDVGNSNETAVEVGVKNPVPGDCEEVLVVTPTTPTTPSNPAPSERPSARVNVSQQTRSEVAAAPQVEAPVGGVSAGGGGSSESVSPFGVLAASTAAGLVGFGRLRARHLEEN